MTITYFPFASGSGVDVSQAQWERMAKAFKANGVIRQVANTMEPFANSTGMNVKVKSGDAIVQGHYMISDAQEQLSIAAADGTNPRIDLVVAEVDMVNNTMEFAVVTGTPSGVAVAPTPTQSASLWQIPLAHVAVGAAVSTIAAGNVTDVRQYAGRQSASASGITTVSTSSTSFVDMTDMLVHLYSRGGDIDVSFSGEPILDTIGGAFVQIQLVVDATAKILGSIMPSNVNYVDVVAGRIRFTGLSAGYHTIKAQWKVSAGTGQIPGYRYLIAEEVNVD